MRRVGVDPDDGLYADHVTAQMRSCAGEAFRRSRGLEGIHRARAGLLNSV